ncbi:MAG: hypothetical protein O8C62_06530 [Candidatus Methanoperedens sp.]|nr:hypothetical protein [Candidatus Methanoperedens sp.]
MNNLYQKLKDIKDIKKENRLGMLQKICNDGIIDEALEIAKHQSSINLPGVPIITALTTILLGSVLGSILDLRTLYAIPIVWIFFVLVIINDSKKWTEVYYDLMELRRIRREETKPTVISQLDIIISKVEEINPRIDVLEKNVSTKIEAIEKGFINIRKK